MYKYFSLKIINQSTQFSDEYVRKLISCWEKYQDSVRFMLWLVVGMLLNNKT